MTKMRTLLILLFPAYFFSQSFSLTYADLVYGKTHTVPETQEYLAKRGYKYIGEQEVIGEAFIKYAFAHGGTNSGVQYGIIIASRLNNKVSSINIVMANWNNFVELKKKFKSMGYILKEPEGEKRVMEERYVKEKSEVIFSTGKDEKLGIYYSITYW